LEKHEVCKSGMFDLRVDFCHLAPNQEPIIWSTLGH